MLKRHINIIKLICYFVIAPIAVWNLSIGKSLSLWRECEKSKRELDELKLSQTQRKSDRVEASANGYLLDSIAENKNIEIVKYNRFVIASVDNYSLVANVLVISGDYFKLMKAVHKMENTWTINSLSLQTETNYKSKQKSLHATIITEEILKAN